MELGGRSVKIWCLIEVTEERKGQKRGRGVLQGVPSCDGTQRGERIWVERQEAVGYEGLQLTRDEAGETDFRV